MGFTCGIVGLPNVGKSTLFNAITAAGAEAANYPFCTIEPNIGVVPVPDSRLDRLAEIYRPPKVTPTSLEFLDIAGLVKGASKGEGLGNQFLSHIRTVDAIVHVVRCFEDDNVVHVNGAIDPKRDIEVVETELILKDLETVEKKLDEAEKRSRSQDQKAGFEAELYRRLKSHLSAGRPARTCEIQGREEHLWVRALHLLTTKPVMYVCNVHERLVGRENQYVDTVRALAAKEGAKVATICAEVEAQVAELAPNEREEFLEGLGMKESGLAKIIREGYDVLHLVTFFTAGPKEVRAWTVRRGTPAPQAAGIIHSDFEKGFIRAEVMSFADLDQKGSEAAVKEYGSMRVEGREYIIEDGDVVFFRFNV